jgi:hypothetical protein
MVAEDFSLLIEGSTFRRFPFDIHFICFANLIDLIFRVLMPLYTHLYNLMADSFIGGNIFP